MTFRKWVCQTCGDIFDEELGAPDDAIPPGTSFDDLPEDWVCPTCGSQKGDFILMEE